MPPLLRDLQRFVEALWREWVVLLTGGTIFAIAALRGLLVGKPIPQSLAWPILMTTLGVASFRVWRRPTLNAGAASAYQDRVAVPLPAGSLAALYRGRTDAEADKLAEPFKGKWLKVAGTVHNVCTGTAHRGRQVVLATGEDVFVFGDFTPEWDDWALMLQKGQALTIIGRIWLINSNQVYLDHSKMLPGTSDVLPSSI